MGKSKNNREFSSRKGWIYMNLYNCVKTAKKGNNDDLMLVFKKFELSIKKFARMLYYPEAETDLTIEFINVIKNIDIEKFSSDDEGQLVMYIYNSLNNRKIDLYRKHIQNKQELIFVEDFYTTEDVISSNQFESDIFFDDFVSSLNPTQKSIISMRYFDESTDAEISEKLGISRQAVCKARNKALTKLRKALS